MNMQTVTSTDIQRNYRSIVNSLSEPVVVMRDSRPEVVVVDYFEFLELKQIKDKSDIDELEKLLDRVHAKNAHIPAKEMKKDIDEAFRYVRSHRRHKHLR
mgnify:CR=1 FL=1